MYSWRGADVNIIKKFSEDAKVIKLEQNYRSTQTIVNASNSLIEHNENRLDKVTNTENAIGEKILSYTGDTEYHEAEFVGGIINYYVTMMKAKDYKDFAILYRTNMQSRSIEDELSNLSIPYRIIGGVSFYDRKEVKDTLAYLKLIINPYDLLSFERAINEPKRGIGEGTYKKISDFVYDNNISCIEALSRLDEIPRVPKKAKAEALILQDILQRFRLRLPIDEDPSKFIVELMIEIGYFNMLEESDEADRVMNIYELANMAERDYKVNEATLEEFIKRVSLISDADTVDEGDNCVQLMTAHISKGLEFDTVFVVGLEENVFPHYNVISKGDANELEEERRLFYVAMTRAEKSLYLTNAESRGLFGKTIRNKPSRFLQEVPGKYTKAVGVTI